MDKKFKQEIQAEVLSPMFSCGNKVEIIKNGYKKEIKKGIPEIRTTEVKGLMRYIYRIASTEKSSQELLKKEGTIFGKSEDMASPICIQMSGNIGQLKEDYLRYKTDDFKDIKDKDKIIKNKSITMGTTFTITLRCFKNNTFYNLENYRDLLELSLILGGIGRRARRGRGCMATSFSKSKNIEELKQWITNKLNFLNMNSLKEEKAEDANTIDVKGTNQYILKNNIIFGPRCFQEKLYKRPVIEKIVFGNELCRQYKNVTKEQAIKSFLITVDDASHVIKNEKKFLYATGHISSKKSGRDNFSSSVIVTLVEAKDGIYPVYIFLKAVYHRRIMDNYKEEQEHFFDLINGRG
ncbi:MAG: hypothetical protein ACFWTJ_10055 [Lachnoclostridium sp.]